MCVNGLFYNVMIYKTYKNANENLELSRNLKILKKKMAKPKSKIFVQSLWIAKSI